MFLQTDQPEIVLPLRLFRAPASRRDDADLRDLVALASEIWIQAEISFKVIGEVSRMPADPPLPLDVKDPSYDWRPFIRTLRAAYDGDLIAVHGLADWGQRQDSFSIPVLRRIVIADSTTLPAHRVLAHELGHLLIGPAHASEQIRLMAEGERGAYLAEPEIWMAREMARALKG